jgi:hypothetical protein
MYDILIKKVKMKNHFSIGHGKLWRWWLCNPANSERFASFTFLSMGIIWLYL